MKQISTDTLAADVNILIKIMKRAFGGFQMLVSQLENSTHSVTLLSKISEETKYLLQILRKHKEIDLNNHSQVIEKLRFKTRENIWQIKTRYESSPNFKCIKGFCQQTDLALKIYEKTNNFVQFTSKIYSLINEQLRMFKIKIDMIEHNDDPIAPQKLKRVYSQAVQSQKNRPVEGKVINFSSLYRLELDQIFMKSTCIFGQKSLMDQIQAQLERNKTIMKNIDDFTKEYFLHRFKCKHKPRLVLGPSVQNKQNIRIKTSVHEKLYRNVREERTRRTEVKEKENMTEQTKIVYKVNSLYVSGNEFNVYCENSKRRWMNAHQNRKKNAVMLSQAFKDSHTAKSCSKQQKLLINFIN